MLYSIRFAITVATSPNKSSNETISLSKMSLLTFKTPPTVSIEIVSVTAELKNVEIRTEINGEPEFIGDLHYTSEAVVNLLKNAIEHTPQGGTVTVTANGSNISSNITIADTGEGIPEKELPHIFERFYRSSEYTKNGFGIGLAFAKKVISAQDGSLKAANHKPHGAMFDIHFYKTTI